MPRHHDPINDFFNELLDATVTTLIDTIRPEFRRLAKDAVTAAKKKADSIDQPNSTSSANSASSTSNTSNTSNNKRRSKRSVTPPQLTLYDILEVSPRASVETISAAYRSLGSRYHPDNKVSGDAEKMKELVRAKEVLLNPEKKKVYDKKVGLK